MGVRLQTALKSKLLARTPGCERREEERRGRGLAISFVPSSGSGGGAGIARRGFQPLPCHVRHTSPAPASVNGCQPHARSSLVWQPPYHYLTAASPRPAHQHTTPPNKHLFHCICICIRVCNTLHRPLPPPSSCCPAKTLRISPFVAVRPYLFGPTLFICSRHRQQEILAL